MKALVLNQEGYLAGNHDASCVVRVPSEGAIEVPPKCDPRKLALAARLRKETTLTIKDLAARLNLGTPRNAAVQLLEWNHKQMPPEPATQGQVGV